MSGMLIVIEGPDGAGKTTLAQSLSGALMTRGTSVRLTREPSDGPIGQKIRWILDECEEMPSPIRLMRMFAADRMVHLATVIDPALDVGAIVVCDRYVLSSYAYQYGVHGVRKELIDRANADARQADLTIVLTAPVNELVERMASRSNLAIFDCEKPIRATLAIYDNAEKYLRGQRIRVYDSRAPREELLMHALREVDELAKWMSVQSDSYHTWRNERNM